jgi:exodeoxyribonuclease V alpha subunit
VDEASMVDLALMAKLVAAVPKTSRLILLGDKDQLASVEAGNVLADICNTGAAAETATSPLRDCIVELKRNYRFAESGAIYRLSGAVNRGDATSAAKLLKQDGEAEVRWRTLPAPARLAVELQEHVLTGFRTCLAAEDPAAALAALQQFRILCAVRKGPYGVEQINSLAEEILAEAGLLTRGSEWYPGRAVMITRNDYNLGLFNGDTGLILRDVEAAGETRAFFFSAEGKLRRFLPARLPIHESAFALTVHKSQGSEFERLLLILPEKDAPVLTRELLYTGITRARSRVEVWSNEEVFREAVARRAERTSGLREALWKPAAHKQLHQSDFGF